MPVIAVRNPNLLKVTSHLTNHCELTITYFETAVFCRTAPVIMPTTWQKPSKTIIEINHGTLNDVQCLSTKTERGLDNMTLGRYSQIVFARIYRYARNKPLNLVIKQSHADTPGCFIALMQALYYHFP